MELLVFDGVVRYPKIPQYSKGGVFILEAVLDENAKKKVTPSALLELRLYSECGLELELSLDGNLHIRGFPRAIFSSDRAEFEAVNLSILLYEHIGVELDVVESPHMRRYYLN